MIENKFIKEAIESFEIRSYIENRLKKVGLSEVKIQKTPLGERIIIKTSRPGLVVGRGGTNIQQLTRELKEKLKLENPQIEIEEVTNYYLDPAIVAEMIANSLERYGVYGFKGIAHRMMENVMKAGARGIEITISGLVPSQKAKTWRFRAGYMKKSGYYALHGVKKAHKVAQLKRCVVGVGVKILPPDVRLPDDIIEKQTNAHVEHVEEQTQQDQQLAQQAQEQEQQEKQPQENKQEKEDQQKKQEEQNNEQEEEKESKENKRKSKK